MSIQDNALIKSRLQHPPPPRPHTGIWLYFSFQRVGNLNLAWVGWAISPDLPSPSSGIHVFYLLVWSCLKVEFTFAKRWLRRKGLQESYSRWSYFFQKNCVWTQFWPRGTGIWRRQSLKVQMPGEFRAGGGGCWSFWIDWRFNRQENDLNWSPRKT